MHVPVRSWRRRRRMTISRFRCARTLDGRWDGHMQRKRPSETAKDETASAEDAKTALSEKAESKAADIATNLGSAKPGSSQGYI